jgi:archaemetzincin
VLHFLCLTRALFCLDANGASIKNRYGYSGRFSAPLILPNDDLSEDPKYPPQSYQAWVRCKDRNSLFVHGAPSERKVIYVLSPPTYDSTTEFVRKWEEPTIKASAGSDSAPQGIIASDISELAEYLKAFYYGVDVQVSPIKLSWGLWDDARAKTKKGKSKPSNRYISLLSSSSPGSATRIRTRPSPDTLFTRQLNLNDILDVLIDLIENPPPNLADAYTLLLIVNHDIYEGEDDDFCCGRAYGASRVAVVSAARYLPLLDNKQGIGEEWMKEHVWPASHCEVFINRIIEEAEEEEQPKKRQKLDVQSPPEVNIASDQAESPLQKAVAGVLRAQSFPGSLPAKAHLHNLHLSRILRTASHELGHCFAMDHCVYYACNMQGTASMAEDVRQPPYLCPVDLAKLWNTVKDIWNDKYDSLEHVIDSGSGEAGTRKRKTSRASEKTQREGDWSNKRNHALLEFCSKKQYAKTTMLVGYADWLRTFQDT